MGEDFDYEDAEPLANVDNGMGDTVGMARSELLKELDEFAREHGLDLHEDTGMYRVKYSEDHNRAVVEAKSYGDIFVPIAQSTAFCEDSSYHEPMSHQNSNDWEIRLGEDGLEINEENIWAAASYSS
jgi:hypothetical protein